VPDVATPPSKGGVFHIREDNLIDGLDIGGPCIDYPARPARQVVGSPYTAIPQSHRFFEGVHDSGTWEIRPFSTLCRYLQAMSLPIPILPTV